jgi:enoyl-CoA hydratase/carnithine racemase
VQRYQPSNAVQDGKKLFYKQLQLNIEDAYAIAGEEMASKMCQAEARAGFDAFLNKVPPPWRKE